MKQVWHLYGVLLLTFALAVSCNKYSAPDTYHNTTPTPKNNNPGNAQVKGGAGRFDTKDTVVVTYEDTLEVRDTVIQYVTDTVYDLDTLVLQDTVIQTLPPVIQPDGGYDVFLRFKRTPCYGTCPWFEVVILQNGLATYKGEKFVDKIGTFQTTFTPAELKNILRYAYIINFFELPDTLPPFRQPPADLPKTIVFIQHSGRAKQVVDNKMDTPAEVTGFENYVDNLINAKNWVQIDR